MYWLLRQIPELTDLPSRERHRIWRRCSKKALQRRRVWAAWSVPALVLLCTPFVVVWSRQFGFGVAGIVLVVGISLAAVSAIWFRQVLIRSARPFMRIERGMICWRCGYDLRGLRTSDRCPECGGTLIR